MVALAGGLIKRVELSDFAKVRANGLNAMKLKDNDSLSFVEKCHKPGSSVLVACNTGRLAHFSADCLRPTSRTAQGVKACSCSSPSLPSPVPRPFCHPCIFPGRAVDLAQSHLFGSR